MESRSDAKKTPINFIWVGPASKIPGHDIGGPVEMALVNKTNPIHFWCLKEHEAYYKNLLKEHPNISIHSIEDHIKEKQEDIDCAEGAKYMQTIYDTSLKLEGRGSIRDRITIKDAFSLFLLQSMGGYVLDTNIIPINESKQIQLRSYERVLISKISASDNPTMSALECWKMYSPEINDDTSKRMLATYFKKWQNAELNRASLIKKKLSLESFYTELGPVMIDSLKQEWEAGNVSLFSATLDSSESFADLHGLRKTYSNTHKFDMRATLEPGQFGAPDDIKLVEVNVIFYDIYNNNLPHLRVLIKYDPDIVDIVIPSSDTPSGDFHVGENPLFFALRLGKMDIAKKLLENGANLDLEVKDSSGQITSTRNIIYNKDKTVIIFDLSDENRKIIQEWLAKIKDEPLKDLIEKYMENKKDYHADSPKKEILDRLMDKVCSLYKKGGQDKKLDALLRVYYAFYSLDLTDSNSVNRCEKIIKSNFNALTESNHTMSQSSAFFKAGDKDKVSCKMLLGQLEEFINKQSPVKKIEL